MLTPRPCIDFRPLILGAFAALGMLLGLASFAPSAQGAIYWSVFKQTPGGGAPTRFIGKANIDGSEKNDELVNFGQITGLLRVAANDSHLYWARGSGFGEPYKSRLYRADTGGQNPTEILESPDGTLYQALALGSNNLFMSAETGPPPATPVGSLVRAGLDGTGANPTFMTEAALGAPSIPGLAVDSQYIYWGIPNGDGASKIGRANIDGSSPDPDFITGRNAPTSIAATENRLFWIERAEGSTIPALTNVSMANIDGTNPSSFATGTTGVTSVAADEDFVYWGTNQGRIGRARHDGTGLEPDFITGITDLASVLGGLAVTTGAPGPGPGPDPDPVAKIGKVTVSGPGKVKRGKTATWKVTIPNTGDATATGVRVAVSGRGLKINTPAAQIAPGKARTEVIKAKLRKPGKFTATFKVNTANAGSKIVKRKITVRK